jgi:hypothetical protein
VSQSWLFVTFGKNGAKSSPPRPLAKGPPVTPDTVPTPRTLCLAAQIGPAGTSGLCTLFCISFRIHMKGAMVLHVSVCFLAQFSRTSCRRSGNIALLKVCCIDVVLCRCMLQVQLLAASITNLCVLFGVAVEVSMFGVYVINVSRCPCLFYFPGLGRVLQGR